jgi:transposase
MRGVSMDIRLYPVTPEFFKITIKPLIDSYYSKSGRPAKISDYQVFCAMLYVLRTGISWRDLPPCFGHWNHIYQRFKRSSDRGIWWKILLKLQSDKRITMNVVMADSTTFKVHRHGGGLKGGSKPKEKTRPV